MKRTLIAVNVVVVVVLAYYAYYLATDFQTPHGRRDMPYFVFVIDTIDLFIHEGGHGVFKVFGRFMHFLGGSLMQVILPVTAIVVMLRTSGPRTLLATLFWLGQNLIDVAVYIDDAPKQQLTLISRYAMHDWRWLCGYMGNLDSAGDIASVVSFLGTVSLLGAIGFGVYYILLDVRDEFFPPMASKLLPFRPLARPQPPTMQKKADAGNTDDIQ
jgi:hypothetical protein